jgi:hypothetical protein
MYLFAFGRSGICIWTRCCRVAASTSLKFSVVIHYRIGRVNNLQCHGGCMRHERSLYYLVTQISKDDPPMLKATGIHVVWCTINQMIVPELSKKTDHWQARSWIAVKHGALSSLTTIWTRWLGVIIVPLKQHFSQILALFEKMRWYVFKSG